ncbi:MAG: sensor histidine kinase [Planctomycetota bacterium]|nr:MAG: sensor histidine kinase [Planctomycetota bacterium]
MAGTWHLHRLRYKMLVPLVIASVLASGMVALLAVWLGQRWAQRDVEQRFAGVRQALVGSRYALTPPILETLAQLTDAHLVLLDPAQPDPRTTLPPGELKSLVEWLEHGRGDRIDARPGPGDQSGTTETTPPAVIEGREVAVGQRTYVAYGFSRSSPAGVQQQMLVLFDRQQIWESGLRAALLPLLSGLASVGLLAVVMHFVTARLASRLTRLQTHVNQIADGNLEIALQDRSPDEIGQLVLAVNRMVLQLRQLWERIERQAEEHLLHQIAGGMAHQLRNTLTGARLALELAQQDDSVPPVAALETGLRQIEIAEEYVNRLMRVAAKAPGRAQPVALGKCMGDLQSAIRPLAQHLGATVAWQTTEEIAGWTVRDGPGVYAAVYNLVINALQSGQQVRVLAEATGSDKVRIVVQDDGPGVDPAVAQRLFDPFVTTKPEGMGLGLPLVQRIAQELDGQAGWWHQAPWTFFYIEFSAAAAQIDSPVGTQP